MTLPLELQAVEVARASGAQIRRERSRGAPTVKLVGDKKGPRAAQTVPDAEEGRRRHPHHPSEEDDDESGRDVLSPVAATHDALEALGLPPNLLERYDVLVARRRLRLPEGLQ